MKHFLKAVLSMSFALLLLAGCGSRPGNPGTQDTGDRSGAQGMEAAGRNFRVENIVSLSVEDPDADYSNKMIYSGAYGGTLYVLAAYQYNEKPIPDMWLYIFRMDTGETEKTTFSLQIPDIEELYVDSMTVTGEEEITLRINAASEGKAPSSFLCRTDLTGKPLDEETPLTEDTGYPPQSGRFCAGTDGFSLFTQAGNQGTDILRYNVQDQTSTVLVSLEGFVNALCPDGQGGLYYILDGSDLWYLAPDGRQEEKLLSMSASGIDLTIDNHLLTDGEGRLAVCCADGKGARVYLLTEEDISSQQESAAGEENSEQAEGSNVGEAEYETIRMTNLFWSSKIDVLRLAQTWAARSGRYRLLLEAAEVDFQAMDTQELDALRTRTLADLASGQGPEMMLVSRDDMRMLAEKGALMDLSEMVPEEIREQLLPCLRELGTVDGTWVGLPGSGVSVTTLCTSNILWDEDSWTLADVLDIADTRDDWDWILGWHDQYAREDYLWDKYNGHELFHMFISGRLGDSPFLNLEQKVSCFDGEEFIRALEFCKRYGQGSNQKDSEEVNTMLSEGNLIAVGVPFYSGLASYSEMMVSLPGCHAVGYPAENGNGNYVNADTYLVFNVNNAKPDAVRDCISFLFSYDNQIGQSFPVRKDVIHDQVVQSDYSGTGWALNVMGGEMAIEAKPDGSSYLEEYCDFLDSCGPEPYCPQAIKDIVEEEVDLFFDGSRSARDTAEVIQRRVQLYFDEQ